MATLQQCNTISDLIAYGKSLKISHDALYFKASLIDGENNNIIINQFSLIDKYYDYIIKISKPYTFNDQEYMKFRFKPKTLSYEVYGTTELWSLLLRINNIISTAQFDVHSLIIPTAEIFDVLNEILILDKREIEENKRLNNL